MMSRPFARGRPGTLVGRFALSFGPAYTGAMQVVEAGAADLARPEVRRLIAMALLHRDDARVDAMLRRSKVYLATNGETIAGQVTISASEEGRGAVIESIAALPECRRAGVGRLLVWSWLEAHPEATLMAETDDGAVGFYHHLGFRILSLGELYPGTVRYRCTWDPRDWEPPTVPDVAARLRAAGIRFWISGGWALDLFLGRQTRAHADVDFDILRAGQGSLPGAFPGWEVYRTRAPGLRSWLGEPYLATEHNVWLRPDRASAWACEAMFMDVDGDDWVYRRQPAVRLHLDAIGLCTSEGIPYLRPEIQLLFKGGSPTRRERDTQDFHAVLPRLAAESRRWLADALASQFPTGHEWLSHLARVR